MDSYEKEQLIYKFIFILMIVCCIVAVGSACITYHYFLSKADVAILSQTRKDEKVEGEDTIDQIAANLRNFKTVVDRYYLGEIDNQKVLDETLKGYIKGLGDEYSEYMTAEDWSEFEASALGNYKGIGIYMSLDKNNNVVVVSTIKGTPAEEAGLQSEDIIVEVDGESVVGESTDVIASKVKGEAGTKVKLKILRGTEYKDFEIERKEIKIYHVESKMLEDKIGYIELFTFDEGCSEEFEKAFEELKNEGAQKLIIDLRYNTGGLVEEALNIADMIVPKDNTLLITKDTDDKEVVTKAKQDPIINMDIVVLVNEYSASASEILAGALKDNEKAKLVGVKTYGKGVIQNVYTLSDESVLKLTVNEYFTPNETKINKIGIEPDYEVELDKDSEDDNQLNKAIEVLK